MTNSKLKTIFPNDSIKIGIFRALNLGDLLCTIPAIRSLRKAYPNAHIDLIGLPWAQTFVELFPHYFDGFVAFEGYPGLVEQNFDNSKFSDYLKEMHSRKYDLIIQMHGSGIITNPFVMLLGAKRTAGFYAKQFYYCPDPELFMEQNYDLHEIHMHLELMKFLGLESHDDSLEYPVTEKARVEIQELLGEVNEQKYVIIHPGTLQEEKRWSAANFAKVGNTCIKQGYTVVITGVKSEAEIIDKVIQQIDLKEKVVNFCGKTTLFNLGALVSKASLVISNDTSIVHIAAALKTPTVTIYHTPNNYHWAPLNRDIHTVIEWFPKEDLEEVISIVEVVLKTK